MDIEKILKSAADELKAHIDARNDLLKSKITSADADEPEYFDQQTCHELMELAELLKTHVLVPKDMVEAVAHVGVNFGYGPFSIEPDSSFVNDARAMLKAAQENS